MRVQFGTVAKLWIGLLTAITAGCDDQNWGDQASAFVDNEVPTISERHVRAQLSRDWQDFFYVFNAELALNIREMRLAVEGVINPAIK